MSGELNTFHVSTRLPRLLVTDLDGTLLNPQDKISPRSIQALLHAQQHHLHQTKEPEAKLNGKAATPIHPSIQIMIASGRPPRSIQKVIELFGGLMIPDAVLCCNGALNYNPRTKTLSLPQYVAPDQCLLMVKQLRDQIKNHKSLDPNGKDEQILIAGRPGFACEVLYLDETVETATEDGTVRKEPVYAKDTIFVCDGVWEAQRKHSIYYNYERIPDDSSMEEFIEELSKSGRGGIVKMNILDRNRIAADVYESLPKELRPIGSATEMSATSPQVTLTYSGPYFLEISAAGVNKGLGLEKYCESQGLDRADVVAFGDLLNDREMLQFAGLGLCMGNGHPDMKLLANRVIGTNADDGVAREIESWFN